MALLPQFISSTATSSLSVWSWFEGCLPGVDSDDRQGEWRTFPPICCFMTKCLYCKDLNDYDKGCYIVDKAE